MSDEDRTRPSVWSIVGKIARRLADDAAVGDRAALRRLDFESPHQPAFWRVVVEDLEPLLPQTSPHREDHERRWAAILAGLAEIAGAGLYAPRRHLGPAAAEARVHEMRFVKLLRAHGDALLSLIRPLARQLISKGISVDWAEVARLVLSDGRADEEDVRRDLARSYFSAVHRQAAPDSETPRS